MRVTVGIKALNEEAHIAHCLESAVNAVAPFGGEVILADSGSTDRTLEIARGYPVRVVQFEDLAERCCGAGAQLAFQFAGGDYFYLLDGDMVLHPDFIARGIAHLEANPDVAGVGGRIVERNVESEEFQLRAASTEAAGHKQPGLVDQLDCGGLYRVAAICEVGYFADRNLHAFEEFELGARLRHHGWQLARIDAPAVDHFGHTASGYRLLWRRMRTGYAGCLGEIVRSALFRPQWRTVFRLSHLWQSVVVIGWWVVLAVALLWRPWLAIPIVAAPIAFLAWRRGTLSLGLYSFASWNVNATGLIAGLFRGRRPPAAPIAARQLQ